jgi:hypothetical protein
VHYKKAHAGASRIIALRTISIAHLDDSVQKQAIYSIPIENLRGILPQDWAYVPIINSHFKFFMISYLVALVYVSGVAVTDHDESTPLIIAHPPSFGPADAQCCCLLLAAGSSAGTVDQGLCPGTRPVVS